MKTHILALGWAYILLGILGLFGAVLLIAIIAGGGLISGDDTAIAITTVVALVCGGFLALVSAPGIVAGIGLLRYRPWGRVLAIILGILNLSGFPVGTVLGAYTLIVLLDNRSSILFENTG